MTFEGRMKQMWDAGYKNIAEYHLRRPIFFLQDEKKNKEFFDWLESVKDASTPKEQNVREK